VQSHRDWDKKLSALAFALRTVPSYTTGYTPAALTFGQELRNTTDMTELIDKENFIQRVESCSPEEYVLAMRQRLAIAREAAKERCEIAHEKQVSQYNKGRLPNPFQEGDLVLRESHVLSVADRGVCHSLVTKYEGPFRLTKKIGENTYVLEDMQGLAAGTRNCD
jgi:hypothetical protein